MLKPTLTLFLLFPVLLSGQTDYFVSYYPAIDSAEHYNRVGDFTTSIYWYDQAFESADPFFEDIMAAAITNVRMGNDESAADLFKILITRWGYEILRIRAHLISKNLNQYTTTDDWVQLLNQSQSYYTSYLNNNNHNPELESNLLQLTSQLGQSKSQDREILERFKRLIQLYEGWPSRDLTGNQAFPFAILLSVTLEDRVDLEYFREILLEATRSGSIHKQYYDLYLKIIYAVP